MRSPLFKKLPSCLLGAIIAASTAVSVPVSAVDGNPPGLFELEGNTVLEANIPGTDWDYLYSLTQPNPPAKPANMVTYTGAVADLSPKTIFWKGGSKDIYDVTEWWYKEGEVPDKDDITNAYAAAFTVPDDVCMNGSTPVLCSSGSYGTPVHKKGDLVVYFGLDRYANSGDAFAGFWFFQDDAVGIGASPSGEFSGAHVARNGDQPGDLLILVEYPQASGAHPEIKIYEWDPNNELPNHVTDALALVYSDAEAECDLAGNKPACAITNTTDLANQPAWPYQPKSGTGLPFESFFEGGVNVTKLLGTTPCFSSFLAETRSSRSETATLKDFAFGNFDVCGASVVKDCKATINTAGDKVTVDFYGSASNTGGLPLYLKLEDSVTGSKINAVCFDAGDGKCGTTGDTVPGDLNTLPATTATFTLGAGQTVRFEGSYEVSNFSNQTSFADTVTLSFYEDAQATEPLDTVTDGADCPPVGTPGIAVDKNCSNPRVSETGDAFLADITGTVKNTGNVKLTGVTLSDTVFSSSQLTVVYDANKDGIVNAGEAAFSNGGDLAAGAWLAFKAGVNSPTLSHSNVLSATGYNFLKPTESVQSSDSATCSLTVAPGLTITKDCDSAYGGGSGVRLVVDSGKVVVEVGNIITVTNTGIEDLKNVVIKDDQVASLIKTSGGANLNCTAASGGADAQCTGTLDAGEVVTFKQLYKPDGTSIVGALSTPNSVFFKNIATAQGTGVLSNSGTGLKQDDAVCELCPPHTD